MVLLLPKEDNEAVRLASSGATHLTDAERMRRYRASGEGERSRHRRKTEPPEQRDQRLASQSEQRNDRRRRNTICEARRRSSKPAQQRNEW